jgi:hypothetical protein
MSTLTPKELSALLSKASEMTPEEDLEAMIARLDGKWRELKRLLRAQEHSPFEEMPDFQIDQKELIPAAEAAPKDDNTGKSWWHSLLSGDKVKFGVAAQKANADSQRLKKLDDEAGIRERLDRIEKHNFSLIIYAIVCTLLILFMVFSSYFLQASYASSKNSLDQPPEPRMAATPGAPNSAAGPALTLQTPDLPTPGVPDSQKLPAVLSTPQGPAIPQVEYVGSYNSNKYHYRYCKWAKYIGPRNERVFHSVAEAQKAGYISCPICRPPLTDEPQTSAR